MNRIFTVISCAAMSTALVFSTPALAEGKHERAKAAIAEARAKIDASAKIGATAESPRLQADAQAALRSAEERLARGDKDEAIAAAHRASQLADTALGEAQRAHMQDAQAAARAAPPVVMVAPPAPTTITTETVKTAAPAPAAPVRRVVARKKTTTTKVAPRVTEKTTTTVTTGQ